MYVCTYVRTDGWMGGWMYVCLSVCIPSTYLYGIFRLPHLPRHCFGLQGEGIGAAVGLRKAEGSDGICDARVVASTEIC